jgi:Histidine kinase-like ATPase domain
MIDEGSLRVLLIRRFGWETLAQLRTATGIAAARHGLSEQQVWQFLLAVHGAAANAVRHGGGSGQLLVRKQAGELSAGISDHGPGTRDSHTIVGSDPGTSLTCARRLPAEAARRRRRAPPRFHAQRGRRQGSTPAAN